MSAAEKRHWSEMLTERGACSEAVEWARTQPDAATAWARCERADWMLWIAVRIDREACRPTLYAIADRAVRFYAPRSLDAFAARQSKGDEARGLHEWAETLRALPKIVDAGTAWYGNAWARAADHAASAASSAAAAAAAAAADELPVGETAADYAASAASSAASSAAADELPVGETAADYAASAAPSDYYDDAHKEALRELADLIREKLPRFPCVAVPR